MSPSRSAPRRLPSAVAVRKILDVVRRIPRGRVATYGQVAFLAGLPGHARQVGSALKGLPEGCEVPWQRVINAKGEISPRGEPVAGPWEGFQRHLLEEEGVAFDARGRVDLDRFGWEPRPVARRRRRADP